MNKYLGLKKISIDSFLNLSSIVILSVCSITLTPILYRTLDPHSFSLVSVSLVALSYITIFEFGISPTATYIISKNLSNPRLCKKYLFYFLVLSVLIGALVFLFLFICVKIQFLFNSTEKLLEYMPVINLSLILIPCSLVTSTIRGILDGKKLFILSNSIKIVNGLSLYIPPFILSAYLISSHRLICCLCTNIYSIVFVRILLALLIFVCFLFFSNLSTFAKTYLLCLLPLIYFFS